MSLPPPALGKTLSSLSSPPSASHSPVASSPLSSSSFDHGPRRPSNPPTGAAAASPAAAPRKGQAARKQHRNQKRPDMGGGGNGLRGSSGRLYDRYDEDAMAEMRALRNTSSRRGQTSITHLLNYAAPARPAYYGGSGGFHSPSSSSRYLQGGSYRAHHNHHHSGNSAIDKARFVFANYRFVVSPKGDYSVQAADADAYVAWNDVLQILASAESQASSCPICLSEPVAPRMARCGHIFCLPCLIRFMHASTDDDSSTSAAVRNRNNSANTTTSSLSGGVSSIYGSVNGNSVSNNTVSGGGKAPTAAGAGAGAASAVAERRKKWKKCPICEDSIYLAEVRPVRFYAGQESPLPRPGDDVVLRLMMRHANSVVALPRESGGADVLSNADVDDDGGSGSINTSNRRSKNTNSTIPWHFAANVLDYARIMKGTGDYMVKQFGHELDGLARQEKEDELLFHEDAEWTQRAMKTVRVAQEEARALGGLEVAWLDAAASSNSQNSSAARKLPVGAEPADSSATLSTLPRITALPRPDDQQQQQQDFFFYMSPPHLYLSPLDIRILKTKYGAFSAFPSTLLPRVEHLSTGHVVDDAMRRRAKYLSHLPAGCLVSFLECDWTDIVPAETLAAFADDIERRRKRNRDKAAQEERERLQAERLERLERLGTTASMMSAAGGAASTSTMIPSASRHSPGDRDEHGFTQAAAAAVVDINDFQPLGASPPNPRPGFAQLASLSTTPPRSGSSSSGTATAGGGGGGGSGRGGRTVWGTPVVATSPSLLPGVLQSEGDDDHNVDDGWLKDEAVLGSLLVGDSSNDDATLAAQLAALGIPPEEDGLYDHDDNGGSGSALPSSSSNNKKKKKKQKITLMSTGGRRGI